MSLRVFGLFAVAVLSSGCVPVTEPLGDIDKAEPDKNLIGSWTVSDENKETLAIDVPAVKGNPKGLMRAVTNGKPDDPSNVIWFFTTSVGKHSYANVILTETAATSPPLGKEGEFAKWKQDAKKRYFVFRYTRDGDKLAVDGGNNTAFEKLMAAEKIEMLKDEGFYATPAGWLAKYLDKNGPETIYDRTNTRDYRRAKK
jgi:hypothetical protein